MSKQKAFAEKGVVYLVGAGPGDPELLTMKAARLLGTADVVLHDDLVPEEIIAQANPHALVTSVGKRCGRPRITQAGIHALMIDSARRNLSVVRLKSGDPLVFGRAGEELQALREACVHYEVVPGITAAFAAAAGLGLSLTDRRSASKLLFASGHHSADKKSAPIFNGPLPQDATLVIYMPGRDFSSIANELLQHGLPADTPCVAVSHAATPRQQVKTTLLKELHGLKPGPAPVLLLVGRALAGALQQPQESAEAVIGNSMTLQDAIAFAVSQRSEQ
jgi:uroporphyrin-III C-methyltransferase